MHRLLLVMLCAAGPGRADLRLDPAPVWIHASGLEGAHLGSVLAPAGDVNGDGFSDFLAGAPDYQVERGRALLFLGPLSALAEGAAWEVNGYLRHFRFGASVAPLGDVDRDGLADFAVGAPGYGDLSAAGGAVFLFRGGVPKPSDVPAWIFEADQDSTALGASVAWAGDVNADGFPDLLVGAPLRDTGEVDAGRAYLFFGSPAGFAASPDWSAEGAAAGAQFGSMVCGAGDVNADGFCDVMIGAAASAALFMGGVAGPGAAPDWEVAVPAPVPTLAGDLNGDGRSDVLIAGPTGVAIYHGAPGGFTNGPSFPGSVAAAAGDVDGDGYADVLVGRPDWIESGDVTGRVDLYLGSASGPGPAPAWFALGVPGSGFGAGLSTAGDLDGDGFAELLVGAPEGSLTEPDEGTLHLYRGEPRPVASTACFAASNLSPAERLGAVVACGGDVDGDGRADLLAGAPRYSGARPQGGRVALWISVSASHQQEPDWTYEIDQTGALLGSAAAPAGDVNGDGFADVIAGAPGYTQGQTDEGIALVFLGKPGGPAPTPSWTAEGEVAEAAYGRSVTAAGDVNGDGYGDIAVASGSSTSAAGARLYLGSAAGLRSQPSWTTAAPEPGDWREGEVLGAGDVNRDGWSDLLFGATRYVAGTRDVGGVFLFLGSASGLLATPWWSAVDDQPGSGFGTVLGALGDLDGDGFAEFAVGAPERDGGAGAVSIYQGTDIAVLQPVPPLAGSPLAHLGTSIAGLGDLRGQGRASFAAGAPGDGPFGRVILFHGTPGALITEGESLTGDTSMTVGDAVGSAGDVDGDGAPDLLLGGPGPEGAPEAGAIRVHQGNGRTPSEPGRLLLPRQVKRGGGRLSLLGRSDSETSFRLRAHGTSPAGRTTIHMEADLQYLSTLLGVIPTRRTPDADPAGGFVDLDHLVEGLSVGSIYHWRLRIASDSPYFPHGPWFAPPPAPPQTAHLRMRGRFSTDDAPPASGAAPRLAVRPNPARGWVELALPGAWPERGAVEVTIVAPTGRIVRRLRGEGTVIWNGRDTEGRIVPAGAYLARARAGEVLAEGRVVWVH